VASTYDNVLEASGWPDTLPRPGNSSLLKRQAANPWFEVYELGPDTFALLEPHHYEEVISYLVLGDERAVLFDTGLGIADVSQETARLSELPMVVINSHSHYDHVGDDHRFEEVWAFDNLLEVSRIERGLTPSEAVHFVPPGSHHSSPRGFDPATYRIRPSPVTRRLQDRERIELGGRTLTVYHTPGHSPGSICLLDSRRNLLVTGDTFYPGTLYAHFAESDLGAYRASLNRLVELSEQVSHLCPAHNEAVVDKRLLTSARDALEQIAHGCAEHYFDAGLRMYCFDGFRVVVADV
jgi:glyoxylase-like metal-dependent hydrolase (beta-lactamase superfamily II)